MYRFNIFDILYFVDCGYHIEFTIDYLTKQKDGYRYIQFGDVDVYKESLKRTYSYDDIVNMFKNESFEYNKDFKIMYDYLRKNSHITYEFLVNEIRLNKMEKIYGF